MWRLQLRNNWAQSGGGARENERKGGKQDMLIDLIDVDRNCEIRRQGWLGGEK